MISGTNPELSEDDGIYNQDKCRGITYDEEVGEIFILLQIKALELRSWYAVNNYDTIILNVKIPAKVQYTIVIDQGATLYDMFTASQGLMKIGDSFYFAGWSYGFDTKYNRLLADSEDPKFDAYLYRY